MTAPAGWGIAAESSEGQHFATTDLHSTKVVATVHHS